MYAVKRPPEIKDVEFKKTPQMWYDKNRTFFLFHRLDK